MTSNHHAPYDLGYTRATMDGSEGGEAARWSETQKPVHSSDCSRRELSKVGLMIGVKS